LELARASIAAKLAGKNLQFPRKEDPLFQQELGAFVTLKLKGELRGCIGYIEGFQALEQTIIEMAQAAAFSDPRFPAVIKEELAEIQIEISILSKLQPVKAIDEIKVGRDGLLIRNDFTSGLLLPQVATEWNWDRQEFLEHTCLKAGLERQAWKLPENKLFSFSAEIFSEEK
jgi:AmmeMemoRadiSam system protein A